MSKQPLPLFEIVDGAADKDLSAPEALIGDALDRVGFPQDPHHVFTAPELRALYVRAFDLLMEATALLGTSIGECPDCMGLELCKRMGGEVDDDAFGDDDDGATLH